MICKVILEIIMCKWLIFVLKSFVGCLDTCLYSLWYISMLEENSMLKVYHFLKNLIAPCKILMIYFQDFGVDMLQIFIRIWIMKQLWLIDMMFYNFTMIIFLFHFKSLLFNIGILCNWKGSVCWFLHWYELC